MHEINEDLVGAAITQYDDTLEVTHRINPCKVIRLAPWPGFKTQIELIEANAAKTCRLPSLLLSYQKKDWLAAPHQSFFSYDTNYRLVT